MVAKMTIPIYYEYRSKGKTHTVLVGLNQIYNMHYMVRAKMVKHFHHIIGKKLNKVPISGKVKTHYTYFYKNSQSDAPNVVAGIDKLFMDALQEAGIIKDDNVLNYIGSSWEVGGQDRANPRIEVEVIENYKILMNTETDKFHIQFEGKEVDEVAYTYAAEAIEAAAAQK